MLPERVAHVRDLCARWVEEGHTPTLGVCVARRGVIVLHEAFGVLGRAPTRRRSAHDALFPVASITKPITATLVMQLVEDGLLGLNRPAKDYLPEISGDGTDEILVHHLLTHTTGYPFHTDPPMLKHASRKKRAGFEPPPCPEGLHPIVHEWLSLLWDAPRVAARRRGDGLLQPQLRAARRDRAAPLGPEPRGAGARAHLRSARHARQLLRGARVRGPPRGAARAGHSVRPRYRAALHGPRRADWQETPRGGGGPLLDAARHDGLRPDDPRRRPLRRRAHPLSRRGGGDDPRPDPRAARPPPEPTKWSTPPGDTAWASRRPPSGSTSTAASSRSGRSAIPVAADPPSGSIATTSWSGPTSRWHAPHRRLELLWNFDLFQNAITAAGGRRVSRGTVARSRDLPRGRRARAHVAGAASTHLAGARSAGSSISIRRPSRPPRELVQVERVASWRATSWCGRAKRPCRPSGPARAPTEAPRRQIPQSRPAPSKASAAGHRPLRRTSGRWTSGGADGPRGLGATPRRPAGARRTLQRVRHPLWVHPRRSAVRTSSRKRAFSRQQAGDSVLACALELRLFFICEATGARPRHVRGDGTRCCVTRPRIWSGHRRSSATTCQPPWLASTLATCGRANWTSALDHYRRGIALARAHGAVEVAGWLLTMESLLWCERGEAARASGAARESLEIAERIESPLSQALALQASVAPWRSQATHGQRCRHWSARCRSPSESTCREPEILSDSPSRSAPSERSRTARAVAERALDLAGKRGLLRAEVGALHALARIHLDGGSAAALAEVRRLLDRAESRAEEIGYRLILPRLYELRADLARRQGDAVAAEGALRAAQQLSTKRWARRCRSSASPRGTSRRNGERCLKRSGRGTKR